MARCPSCHGSVRFDVRACPLCNASFEGELAWHPIPDTATEDKVLSDHLQQEQIRSRREEGERDQQVVSDVRTLKRTRFECMVCNASRFSIRAVFAVSVICAVIALEAPLDVVSSSPALREFVELMSGIFPVIEHYSSASRFPEVTQFYMASMLVAFPLGLLAPLVRD